MTDNSSLKVGFDKRAEHNDGRTITRRIVKLLFQHLDMDELRIGTGEFPKLSDVCSFSRHAIAPE